VGCWVRRVGCTVWGVGRTVWGVGRTVRRKKTPSVPGREHGREAGGCGYHSRTYTTQTATQTVTHTHTHTDDDTERRPHRQAQTGTDTHRHIQKDTPEFLRQRHLHGKEAGAKARRRNGVADRCALEPAVGHYQTRLLLVLEPRAYRVALETRRLGLKAVDPAAWTRLRACARVA